MGSGTLPINCLNEETVLAVGERAALLKSYFNHKATGGEGEREREGDVTEDFHA